MFAVMHDLRLIHTDLKPENILLVSAEYVKVPDYKVPSSPSHAFCFLTFCQLLRMCVAEWIIIGSILNALGRISNKFI